ncbi:hypothetical protein [Sulfobacillus harzensis]|uniref:Uncharacterized protein n=1 Tax=Sulfobacillus harzensis TaxID=2729629 RepID=A0A7Y0L972_9FIRM|nr:hypothetical protein [Sulfobacillus harzensis]NMP24249.1 hypothetical protein [Sulfobacillus harzensis]
MPTLPSIPFSFTSKAGEHLEWHSTVSVDRAGMFHCTFPEELVEVARVELRAFRKSPFDPLTIEQPRTQWQVQGPNLEECKAFLRQVAEAYLRTETTTERIIMYHIDPAVAYFRLKDGTIRPNAAHLSDEKYRAGAWQGNEKHSTFGTDHYRLGLFARVLDRVTEQRGEHVAVRYVLPKLPDDSWGARLNSWTHLAVPEFRSYDQPWPHVPYTEPAAEFFYRMILRLCEMTDQLTTFFTDPVSVAAALDGADAPALPAALFGPTRDAAQY